MNDEAKTEPLKCRVCKQSIQWEQLGGMRLMGMKARSTKPVYRTRCGCGEILRDANARKVRR